MNLAAEMAKLPEPPNDSKPPFWDFWRHDLWARAQEDGPENFVKWPCVYHTMLVEHWRSIIESAEVPHVRRSIDLGATDTADGLNLYHQAYHLIRWQEATGQRIADTQSIYEFGGGYGAMRLAAQRLGFTGAYYIYDLPEFALLQKWYLDKHDVQNVRWFSGPEYGVVNLDLFIACYSLSETNYTERNLTLDLMPASSYLFLYSNKFAEYDNAGYFQSIEYADMPNKRWRHEHIEHLPPESWYTWGW